MQLFLVLLIWGQVGVVVGPLQTDMATCLDLAGKREAALDASFAERSVFIEKGQLVWRKDLAYGCGLFEQAPALRSTPPAGALTFPDKP